MTTIVVVFVGVAVTMWIAVAWHRFVLLQEMPAEVMPAVHFDRVLAYVGRGLMVALVLPAIFVPGLLILMPSVREACGVAIAGFVIFLLISYFVFYRISLVLPAAAIGAPFRTSEAWRSTSGASAALVLLTISVLALQALVSVVFGMLVFAPLLQLAFSLLVGIGLIALINVSILTTLYGAFVEKGDLA